MLPNRVRLCGFHYLLTSFLIGVFGSLEVCFAFEAGLEEPAGPKLASQLRAWWWGEGVPRALWLQGPPPCLLVCCSLSFSPLCLPCPPSPFFMFDNMSGS